jgi:hypothetical protein
MDGVSRVRRWRLVVGGKRRTILVCVVVVSMLGWLAPPAGAVRPMQVVPSTAITVTNNTDKVDADTSSVEALQSNPGPDGISLREAIEATNNDPGSYAIAFSSTLSGTTITLGQYLPPLTGGGVSIEGDINGDGTPDVTLVTTLQEEWSRAIQIASSGNRLHGLTLQGFAVGVWIDPATGDELPTRRTLADNAISGLAIRGIRIDGIMFHSPASPDCGLPMPDPCRTYITFANTTITGNTIETIPARGAGINMQISNSGDRIAGATVTGNTIRIGGGAGIELGQNGNAGDDGTPARISEVLIARNSIEGIGAVGIEVLAGASRAQGNITEGVRVLDNRVHVACRARKSAMASPSGLAPMRRPRSPPTSIPFATPMATCCATSRSRATGSVAT